MKEWFTAQGSRRGSSDDSSPRFTCPSCRAEVLRTRTNATVTTLLDMVLAAHPERARSAAEKEEIAERYNPAESVFPPPREDDDDDSEDEDDRRVLQEVQELSLRESRAQARREARRAANSERTRDRSSNPERSAEDGRSRRRRGEDSERQQSSARTHGDTERARRVEHQSSLRSLLSLSSEAETMQEEILRQILEEGLLDDIDFDNLSATQEEELSERIADAYRRSHMQQPRAPQAQRRRQSPEDAGRTRSRSQSVQRPSETTPTTSTRDNTDRRPPATRPHLLDPPTSRSTPNHQRRNSEQADGRRRTSPTRINSASDAEDALRPAVRSSSDMTAERTRSSQNARTRAESSSTRPRRATESDQGISDVWMSGGRERASSRHVASQPATSSPTSTSSPQLNSPQNSTSTDQSTPALSSPRVPPRSNRRPSSTIWTGLAPSSAQYVEPSISCDRCGKADIQYDVHKQCAKCKDPNYRLCLRCYRTDGDYPSGDSSRSSSFDPSAQAIYERILASPNHRPAKMRQTGHILRSFKYERPSENAQVVTSGERKITNDNPTRRLISGLFCDICQSPANDCFWKCSRCNEGDWGFCNRCVNQGRCCTHPLLPIRRITGGPKLSATSTPADANNPLSQAVSETFKTLSFSTNCDICTYPIPASVTRFHCLQCNNGDYDVCTNCYLKLVATSKISKENGHNGWRRCLASHRMILVGFEDRDDGQRRVIVRDLVGGNALQDEHIGQSPSSSPALSSPASPERGNGYWSWKEGSERRKKASRLRGSATWPTSSNPNSSSSELGHSSGTPTSQHGGPFRRFPPDGGVGLVVQARWSYFPGEENEDELFFPRGAEIKEVDDVNDEWFWGSYAGRTGLFPGSHVAVVAEIK